MDSNITKESSTPSEPEAKKIKEKKLAAQKLRGSKANEIITQLKTLFPQTFMDNKVPLKREIYNDVLAFWQKDKSTLPEASNKMLHFTFNLYTRNLAYHKACVAEDAQRIDLNGNAVANITEQERTYHQENIDNILASRQKKKTKQKQQVADTVNREILEQGKATLGTQFSVLLKDVK